MRSKIVSHDTPLHRLKPTAISTSSASVPPTAPSSDEQRIA